MKRASAAETTLTRAGAHVAFAVRVGDAHEALVVLDVRGEPVDITEGWPVHARWQNAITNFQETGRFDGFGRRRYGIDPPVGDDREPGGHRGPADLHVVGP